MAHETHISSLQPELLVRIFQSLDQNMKAVVPQVCRAWLQACEQNIDTLWQNIEFDLTRVSADWDHQLASSCVAVDSPALLKWLSRRTCAVTNVRIASLSEPVKQQVRRCIPDPWVTTCAWRLQSLLAMSRHPVNDASYVSVCVQGADKVKLFAFAVAAQLMGAPRLRSLSLADCRDSHGSLLNLIRSLPHMQHLRRLDVLRIHTGQADVP